MGVIDMDSVYMTVDDGAVVLPPLVSVTFPAGSRTAILGPNGAGKSTMLKTITGENPPSEGTISVNGSLLMVDQFVAPATSDMTIQDLMLRYAPPQLAEIRKNLDRLEETVVLGEPSERDQLAYASAIEQWGSHGGWDLEVAWDTAATRALHTEFSAIRFRRASSLSGGEQRRLVLELAFNSDADVLLLDEPDNFLDLPSKHWLEESVANSRKTVIFVSHDRAFVEAAANRLITVEGAEAWTFGGHYRDYAQARKDRYDRFDEILRRWEEGRVRVYTNMIRMKEFATRSAVMADRYKASITKYEKYLTTKPDVEPPPDNTISLKFSGSRSGNRVLIVEDFSIPGLITDLNVEVDFGDRVCLTGANGTGKSHFLKAISGEDLAQTGTLRLGSSVHVGSFSQMQDAPPESDTQELCDLVRADLNCDLGSAMSRLSRYGLKHESRSRWSDLSGGQRARLSLLLIEGKGANLLLLDEPTDHLDIESAEALERTLASFKGTVIAVSHDRWFIEKFDRFLHFSGDGSVTHSLEPSFDYVSDSERREALSRRGS